MRRRFETREAWLTAAADVLCDMLAAAVPDCKPMMSRVQISIAYHGPSRLGLCVYTASEDDTRHVSVDARLNGEEAIACLAHELIHASLDSAKGHGRTFQVAAAAMGLEGPPSATYAGAELRRTIKQLAKKLGPYPHSVLVVKPRTKRTFCRFRVIKCPDCGFLARSTRKWIENSKLPVCGDCACTFVAELDPDDEPDAEQA